MTQVAQSKDAEALCGVLPAIPLIDSPLFPSLLSAGAFGSHQPVAEPLAGGSCGLVLIMDLEQQSWPKLLRQQFITGPNHD